METISLVRRSLSFFPKPSNSQQKEFSVDNIQKHHQWLANKNAAVRACVEQMKINPQQTAWDILEFLAAQRRDIAIKADPGGHQENFFGMLRTPVLNNPSKNFSTTFLTSENSYQDFLATLGNIFKPSPGSSSLTVEYEGKKYTRLYKFNDGSFSLIHTNLKEHAAIKEKINDLFRDLNKKPDTLNKEEKIKIILEMHFHIAHAMFWHRGSAAIGEMFIETLCKRHDVKINLLLPVPLDLIAIFSSNPYDMIENYDKIKNSQDIVSNSETSVDSKASDQIPISSLALSG